jgi:hypothetical protein
VERRLVSLDAVGADTPIMYSINKIVTAIKFNLKTKSAYPSNYTIIWLVTIYFTELLSFRFEDENGWFLDILSVNLFSPSQPSQLIFFNTVRKWTKSYLWGRLKNIKWNLVINLLMINL